MRVLVAGSEGLLMQATITHLLKEGHWIRGVDNFGRHGRVQRERGYEFIEGDLRGYDFVSTVMDGIELVIQGAGAAFGVVAMDQRPADLLSNDLVLHANILRAAVEGAVQKVAYVSSSMVYEQCLKTPMAEDDFTEIAPIPQTALGLSKMVGERLSQSFFKQYGLRYTLWRPFNIIAPGEKAGSEAGISHVYADLIRKMIIENQDPVHILGDGQQIRCFIWVDDIAEAIAKFSLLDRTDSREYNLGNPEPVTILELAGKIHEQGVVLGIRDGSRPLRFYHGESPKGDVRTLIPSIDRAQMELSWQPTVSLDQALNFCIQEALRVPAESE